MIKRILPLRAFLKQVDFCNYRNNENKPPRTDQGGLNKSIVLYDHTCPLCRQEMQRLKSLDDDDQLVLLSINSPLFSEAYWGVSYKDVSRSLHVLTAEKIWLVGMPAIRHVYAQVGLGWLMAPSGWPVISWFADMAYRFIAPNRYFISHSLGIRNNNSRCSDKVCSPR